MAHSTSNSQQLHSMLQYPLNMAHALDRKAENFMRQQPPNYCEAIKCHQLARAKIDEVLMTEAADQQGPYVNGPRRPLLVSLYGQKERHIYLQKVILSKQQKALSETKERSYVATVREKKTELALLEAHKQEKLRIERAYNEHTELYDNLKVKLAQEQGTDNSIIDEYNSSSGKKKPKSHEETIEELTNMHTQFKYLSNRYATAIMRIKTELMTLKEEKTARSTQKEVIDSDRADSLPLPPILLNSSELSIEKPAPFLSL